MTTYGNQREGFTMIIEGPEAPTLDHLHSDVQSAVEKGIFEVETPRVHVDQTDFQRVDVSIGHGPQQIGQLASKPGPEMLELEIEWTQTEPEFQRDVSEHLNQDCPLALYGDLHVWNVQNPITGNVSATFDPGIQTFGGELSLGWDEFAAGGWR
jgi:hypothetical protein